jgi:hypothetical protein
MFPAVFAMAHCIATAVYAAKGPWQERVRFGALPMSMRAAFIAPHGLLVLAALAGLYLPIVDAYKACDGMTMTVIMLDILACSWFAWARKYKKPPAVSLLWRECLTADSLSRSTFSTERAL